MHGGHHAVEGKGFRDNQLFFKYIGLVELRESVGIFIKVVIGLVKHLVGQLPTGVGINNNVEVQCHDLIGQLIIRRNQGDSRVQCCSPHIGERHEIRVKKTADVVIGEWRVRC